MGDADGDDGASESATSAAPSSTDGAPVSTGPSGETTSSSTTAGEGEDESSDSESGIDDTGTDTSEPVDPLDPWGPPQLVVELSSDGKDDDPSLAPNLLEIYFASNRDGPEDIYVATRTSLDEPWGVPVPVTGLGPVPPQGRGSPAVSLSGTTLFFSQNLGGDIDLYVATRVNAEAPFSDPIPVDALNTRNDDFAAAPGADLLTMVFARNSGSNADLWWTSRPSSAAAWGEPMLITEVSSPAEDSTPWISPDATVLMFSSNRPDEGLLDLYVSTRQDVDEPWQLPMPVDSLNTEGDEQDPWFSADGRTLFFSAGPARGEQNLFTATR